VVNDLLFATKGLGEEPRIVKRPEERLEACSIDGSGWTRTVQGRTELLLVTNRLQQRGWAFEGPEAADTSEEGTHASLTSGDWLVFVGIGPVPEEVKGQAGSNTGSYAFSAQRTCAAP
jgi:hypothetical protein